MRTHLPLATTGVFQDRFRYVRIGVGPRVLVVLPGLSLTNRAPGKLTLLGYAQGFRSLTTEHTLYIVQRPSMLRTAASTRDIAAEYADMLRHEFGTASIDLIGISTGGMIAQYLALDHSDLIDRLVLVVSGARLAPRGRAICARWRELAASGQWRRLHGDMAAEAVDGTYAKALARAFLALTGEPPTAVEAVDFITTVDAVLSQDSRPRLAGLAMPVLLIGAQHDAFFPTAGLQETAAPIPNARLNIYPRTGHGLPKKHAAQMATEIHAFLTHGR